MLYRRTAALRRRLTGTRCGRVDADIGQAVVAEHTQGVQRLRTISDDLPDCVV